ncbi:dTDP-4-dehydrorhamnose reductase [Microbulbifer sp. OS29]|uniref:dTDP-4-dehydrorhamnose reductase n=1 Tax=Microbulbifer okhotskensis TaxID=2926617 RepID=A0A9X2ELK4_9GAMM|nr:dTDP-4-dehydrorhamnose reductase [Microbulbifer okhotskensis]MCO1334474.1 dTDP-4-dehydrorhamnose reductase [Microbulbifer okhotskensis]
MTAKKILITGKNGQLGCELQNLCPDEFEMVAMARKELDISNSSAVLKAVEQAQPDIIINAAAYTAVDRAEQEREAAFSVNARGAENIALACKQVGARFIHVSTDFVFDGKKSSPYIVSDKRNPLGVYGASKAEAEAVVQKILPESVIVRTAWVYSAHGNNFANTMLRLMAERDELAVVADQVGTPTWTGTIAEVLFALARKEQAQGIYHCTDLGVASWYDFAVAIYEEGKSNGLLPANKELAIKAITTQDYPTPAQRPSYSVLDKSRLLNDLDVDLRNWRESLRQVFSSKAQKLKAY